MNLARLKYGDPVEVNVRGRVFRATYLGYTDHGGVQIAPPRGISYHNVNARQIVKKIKAFDPAATQHKG